MPNRGPQLINQVMRSVIRGESHRVLSILSDSLRIKGEELQSEDLLNAAEKARKFSEELLEKGI